MPRKIAVICPALLLVCPAMALTNQIRPSFNRDVAPILYENCARCHRPGEVAPFSLLTYRDAAKRAGLIATVTDKHLMPPWKPDRGPRPFLNERRLTEKQIATLADWAANGAPEGTGGAPPLPNFTEGWALGKPDLVVTLPQKFHVPADGPDIVNCFVIPLNFGEDRYVRSAEFRADARSVVHHSILYVDSSGKARKLDAATAEPGYSCFGGPSFLPSAALGGWAPGWVPQPAPAETAVKIAKGADLIVQIHYHPSGKAKEDQSSVGLIFTEKPARELVSFLAMTESIDIPAEEPHYVASSFLVVPNDVDVIGVVPHAHYLCKEVNARAVLPDGSAFPLIHIADWDFNWQGVYQYDRPIRLPKGTRIEMSYVYDNSSANPHNPSHPPRRVKYGEKTTDEMAALVVTAMLVNQSDSAEFHRAIKLAALDQLLREGTLRDTPNAPRLKRLLRLQRLFAADPNGMLTEGRRARVIRLAGFWLDLTGASGPRCAVGAAMLPIGLLILIAAVIWTVRRILRRRVTRPAD